MLSMIGYAEALFGIGCAAVTIIPRPASSTDWIGGDLASPFRKSILLLTAMNVLRNVLFDDRRFRDICSESMIPMEGGMWTVLYYVSTSVESFGKCFLMLLMPYLLQKRLSEVINIRPGEDLMSWLQAILLLNVLGVVTAQYNPNLWAFKRFGDALGCIPVIKSLRLFRRIQKNSAAHDSHMTIKILEAVEGYSFVITTMAAAAYLFDDHSSVNLAIRVASIFFSILREMFHGHLLNVIDDASHVPDTHHSMPSKDQESMDPEFVDEKNQELISLRLR